MEKFIKKEFCLHKNGQIILKNRNDILALIENRVKSLTSLYGNKVETSAYVENLFAEFVEIYEYDKKTAMLPEPFGYFENEIKKSAWVEKNLLAQDLDLHLGSILYNYHEWLAEHGLPDIILGRFVVDYPVLYERALYDYISVLKGITPQYGFQICHSGTNDDERIQMKKSIQREPFYTSQKAYTASFILPILIEHFLISFTQQDIVEYKVRELFQQVDRGKVCLSMEEMNFMKPFIRKSQYMNGNRFDSMKKCYEIFARYSLINEKEGYAALIRGCTSKGRVTLGAFLKNGYVKKYMKPAYYSVMEMLFSTDKLDIRNSIMHGIDLTFDPFAMCNTAVMLQLFWQIMDRNVIEICV